MSLPTYTPQEPFITPPFNQGQIVDKSYALDAEAGVIIERIHDGGDGSTEYHAYEMRNHELDEDGACVVAPDGDPVEAKFEPQNDNVALGGYLGACDVEPAGHHTGPT